MTDDKCPDTCFLFSDVQSSARKPRTSMQSLPPASGCLVLCTAQWLGHRRMPGDAFCRAPEAGGGTEHSPTVSTVRDQATEVTVILWRGLEEPRSRRETPEELAHRGNLRIPSHSAAQNPLGSECTSPCPFLLATAQMPPLGARPAERRREPPCRNTLNQGCSGQSSFGLVRKFHLEVAARNCSPRPEPTREEGVGGWGEGVRNQ